jgi:hypothetical protein
LGNRRGAFSLVSINNTASFEPLLDPPEDLADVDWGEGEGDSDLLDGVPIEVHGVDLVLTWALVWHRIVSR